MVLIKLFSIKETLKNQVEEGYATTQHCEVKTTRDT